MLWFDLAVMVQDLLEGANRQLQPLMRLMQNTYPPPYTLVSTTLDCDVSIRSCMFGSPSSFLLNYVPGWQLRPIPATGWLDSNLKLALK